MAATPTFTFALYSPGPISSNPSHPGSVRARMAGSRNAFHTRSSGAGMSFEPPYRRRHAAHAFLDGLEPGSIGQADVGIRAEVDAGYGGDARLVEQEGAHVARAFEDTALPALAEERRDVREHIEGALGHHAGDTGDGVEGAYDEPPPSIELAHHLGDLILRPGERLDPRPLRDGGGIRGDLALYVGHGLDDGLGSRGVTEAPARHGVGLGAGVDHEGARLDLRRERGDGHVASLVGEGLVALVGDDPEAALHRELPDVLQGSRGEYGARGITRAVEHDDLRPRRHRAAHGGGIEIEARGLRGGHGNRHAA